MKRPIVLIFLILALIGFFKVGNIVGAKIKLLNAPVPTLKPMFPKLNADKLFSLINEWRISQGYAPYIKENRLCDIAKDRSDDSFTHQGLYDKYSSLPYSVVENLAIFDKVEEDTLKGWLNSPPHRATLEKPYKYSCVACDKQCVQIFSNL